MLQYQRSQVYSRAKEARGLDARGLVRLVQRPNACVAVRRLQRAACSCREPGHRDEDVTPERAQQGTGEANGEGGSFQQTPTESLGQVQESTVDSGAHVIHVTAAEALAGLAAEASNSVESPNSRQPQSVSDAERNISLTDPKGWYGCHLFEFLQDACIDVQSAGLFFSQLAMRDSWLSPLSLDELLHAVRIADITGFALPPIVASQLQQLVQARGPVAASASAEPLLAAFGHDLPLLLDMLYGMEVKPSYAWTQYALQTWLTGGAGAAASGSGTGFGAGPPSVAGVRLAMVLVEALYLPDSEPWVEPPPLPHPDQSRVPFIIGASTQAAAAGSAAATATTPAATVAAPGHWRYTTPQVDPFATAHVRAWLDACVLALLDSGGLARPHEREDLYAMLPLLATVPSAAVIERLYLEAPPPQSAAAAAAAAAAGSGHVEEASAEHLAALLWLFASSGAKLPPAAIQSELRALERALFRLARGLSENPGSGRGGNSRGGDLTTDSNGPAKADAAAALKAAFALPSAPGLSGSIPPPSGSTAPTTPSTFSPPPFHSLSASSSRRWATQRAKRLSTHGAYLSLWAFHHYRHSPSTTVAHIIGPPLMSTALAGAQDLSPRQRCRVLRAALLCFGPSVWQRTLGRSDWSPLLAGWEVLRAEELLPLLTDLATLARTQRNRSRLARRSQSSGAEAGTGPASDAAPFAAAAMAAASTGGGGGGAGAGPHWQVQLVSVATHLLRLPGWPERLQGLDLCLATTSVSSLLEILAADDADDEDLDGDKQASGARSSGGGGQVAAASEANGVSRGGAGGSGSSSVLPQGFAAALLESWLACVLPVIQDGIKQVTEGDWGGSAQRLRASRNATPGPAASSAASYDVYDMFGGSGGGSRQTSVDPMRAEHITTATSSAVLGPGRSIGGATKPVPGAAHQHSQPQVPVLALSAADVLAALTALRDAAAALDARSHPAVHRTLMWALQRLGSRAGRCAVDPGALGRVPDMLVKMESLGWVDVPVEWVDAVVLHPDTSGAWFRSLPWPEALRAVLISGQLIQRARTEVLRRHGVATWPGSDPEPGQQAQATGAITANPLSNHHLHSIASTSIDGLGQSRFGDAAPAPSHVAGASAAAASGGRPTSKAATLFDAASRLRDHLLGLLATRASSITPTELRQLVVTWQVYAMPYDREAMAAVLSALAGTVAPDDGAGGDGQTSAGEDQANRSAVRRTVWDAVRRLETVCASWQVPQEEAEQLFAGFRRQAL